MNFISELTCQQWTYIFVKVFSIIGIIYAACSSMISSDSDILMKSYNTLPDLKVYGLEKDNIILNIPSDIIYNNLKSNTSLFLGFLVSALGFIFEILFETEEINGKKLLIVAIPISVLFYFVLYLLSVLVSAIRYLIICHKIKRNKIFPISYNVYETNNVNDERGSIVSSKNVKNCSWERMFIDGCVKDKN